MTQLTDHPGPVRTARSAASRAAGSLLGRLAGPPPDPRSVDELELIRAHRTASPPTPEPGRAIVREYRAEDRAAVEEMTARCSRDSLRRRFHGPLGDARPSHVADLLGTARSSDHLVAAVDGAVVGIATLHRGPRGDGEIAVLVEDAWQSSGVGTRLTAHLIRRAADRGVPTIVADVMREPAFVLDRLRRAVADTSVDFDGPIATVRIPVALAAGPAPGASS